ncbi:MAG: peptidase MA family metallohydrolase [Myxococcaceae bacterium]
MGALLAALVVAAAPGAQQARALATQGAWEELYLGYSSADPAKFSPPDRKVIGLSLAKGCAALAGSDAVMGYSLGERAAAFEPSAEGLLCLARTAAATDQRGSAEEALRKGLKAFPKQGGFGLALGKLLLEDKDPAGALAALGKVPKKSAEYKEAQALSKQARAGQAEETAAKRQAQAVERALDKGEPPPDGAAARGGAAEPSGSLTYESGIGPGGVRTRSNARFAFRYFSGDRDFGQRADYEGQIASALEEAYRFTKKTLGEARETQVDVILYTKEEFVMHHGAGMASMVAGFYSEGAIRINDAAIIDANNTATLVHEYVHAAVDDFTGNRGGTLPIWVNEGLAEYVEWRFKGIDGAPAALAIQMRGAALGGRLPTLTSMTRGTPLAGQQNAPLRYAVAAMAVKLLLADGGPDKLLGLIREVGQGGNFDKGLEARYSKDLPKLEEELQAELSRHQ